jgi:hypothetical protein
MTEQLVSASPTKGISEQEQDLMKISLTRKISGNTPPVIADPY